MPAVYQTQKTQRDPATGQRVPMVDAKGRPVMYDRWRFEYVGADGKRVFGTGYKTKRETEALAAKLEREAMEIRKGWREPPSSARKHATRSFADTVADYIAWGKTQGGRGGRPWNSRHAYERETKLAWWGQELNLQVLGDLAEILPKAEKALRRLIEADRAPKTVEEYRGALLAFCSWAQQRNYIDRNPLDGMSGFDTTPRTIRRAMTEDEIRRLLAAAPEHRRLLYEVAFCTGLRAGELRALTPQHIDHNRCGLRLDAAWTKNRRAGFQHLPRGLLNRLVAYAESRDAQGHYGRHNGRRDAKKDLPANPLLFVPFHASRSLGEDLAAAEIPKQTPEGKLDFHACRTAYVNLVLATGVDAKTAQEAARHATLSMTLNTYGRAREDAMKKLADRVGAVVAGEDPEGSSETFPKRLAAGAESLGASCVYAAAPAGSKPVSSTI